MRYIPAVDSVRRAHPRHDRRVGAAGRRQGLAARRRGVRGGGGRGALQQSALSASTRAYCAPAHVFSCTWVSCPDLECSRPCKVPRIPVAAAAAGAPLIENKYF